MPKAILEFKLPEEQREFDSANKGAAAVITLRHVSEYIRNRLKYHEHTEAAREALEGARKELIEEAENLGILTLLE